MDDGAPKGGEFPELEALVASSFPDLRCLRCGHDVFFLEPAMERKLRWFEQHRAFGPNLPYDQKSPMISLICGRCGFVEQHVTSVLQAADKPIPQNTP